MITPAERKVKRSGGFFADIDKRAILVYNIIWWRFPLPLNTLKEVPEMAFCRNCGQLLEETVKYCPNCGTARPDDYKAPETALATVEEPRAAEPEPAPAQYETTNGLAIAGFICAFFFPFVGLVLSIIALKNAKDGRFTKPLETLATWGVIVSAILLAARLIIGVIAGVVVIPVLLKWIAKLLAYISSMTA
jgi:hypothetical protein